MAIWLKQSTASQEVPIGMFADSTDGNTEETGLTIANTDIKIWKFGATALVNKNSGGATHMSNGVYYAVLDATDTNTLGSLVIWVHVAGALVCRTECLVLAANVYDALVAGSDRLQVHADEITAGLLSGVTITAVSGAVGSVTTGVTVTTNNDKTGYRLSSTGVDDVWDEAMSGHTTAGTYGDKLRAHAAGVLKALVTSGSSTTAVVLNATTGIEGGAPSSTNDFYNGRVIIFITGALAGQATDITDYVGSTKTLTVTALTSAPSSGDTAVIV